jgi:hypothetical protein
LAWEDVAALRPEIGPPPETALRSPPPPPKVEVVGTVKKRITAKDFVYESVVNGRYPRRADETEDVDYAKRLLRYAPKDWAAETITNEFARLRKDMPDLKF